MGVMVAPSRRTAALVVKPAPSRRRCARVSRLCVVCGAELRHDHGLGDLVCDHHPHAGYRPRCDARLDNRVMTMLSVAWPEPVNLLRALGTQDRWAVHEAVQRWRARGVPIVGVPHVGYCLGTLATVGGGDGGG